LEEYRLPQTRFAQLPKNADLWPFLVISGPVERAREATADSLDFG
jgi:hypothetical protein